MADQSAGESVGHGTVMTTAADVGSARYMSKFSKPFDLEGLFSLTDRAVLDDAEDSGMTVDDEVAAADMVGDEYVWRHLLIVRYS